MDVKDLANQIFRDQQKKGQKGGNGMHKAMHTHNPNMHSLEVDPEAVSGSMESWPALTRYLVAELERLGELSRDQAKRIVTAAVHNATATGQARVQP